MIILLSILFGLLSMAGFSISNAHSKPLSQTLGAGQTLFLRGITVVVVLGIAAIPSFHYLHHTTAALATILLGAVGYIPVLAFTHALKESRIGIIAPIAGTSSLFTLLLSYIFLNVTLHPGQWIAVIAIVAANIAASVDVKNWRQSKLLQASSGIPFALIASIGWGLFFFFLVYSVRALGSWVAAWLAEIGVVVAAGLHVYLTKRVKLTHAFRPQLMINGLLICIGTAAFTYGAAHYNVGVVAALSNSTALLSAILGYYFFKERLHLKEKLAGAVMVLGVVAISLL